MPVMYQTEINKKLKRETVTENKPGKPFFISCPFGAAICQA